METTVTSEYLRNLVAKYDANADAYGEALRNAKDGCLSDHGKKLAEYQARMEEVREKLGCSELEAKEHPEVAMLRREVFYLKRKNDWYVYLQMIRHMKKRERLQSILKAAQLDLEIILSRSPGRGYTEEAMIAVTEISRLHCLVAKCSFPNSAVVDSNEAFADTALALHPHLCREDFGLLGLLN